MTATTRPSPQLTPVAFPRVEIDDGFWATRMRTNREVTIDAQYKHCKSTGRIDGIDPQFRPGDRDAHHCFWDSDVAKWIESASYTLAVHPDSELDRRLDEVIEKFGKLQTEDGYANSWFTSVEPEKRWTNLRDMHELYCAGHLIEAAVAHHQATGKSNLLDIVCRYADCIDGVFGREQGKRRGYCGHPEIELALVKLHRHTGNERYLRLAEYFVDERGSQPYYFDIEAEERGEKPWSLFDERMGSRKYEYCQAHTPVRDQAAVTGHAVRAMYLYCAMADVAKEIADRSLLEACRRLWDSVSVKRMYVTGGIGPSGQNEGFTFEYDLPEESAYCETCAAIGLTLWSHRMLHLEGDGRYADVMERTLYNGTISGVSLSGDRFFYVNPLASLGRHQRQDWFGCACCPGNISRLIAGVGGYAYSEGPDEAWVHLWLQGSADLDVGSTRVRLEQQTDYPWDGTVKLTVRLEKPTVFSLILRIPGWCRGPEAAIDGRRLDLSRLTQKGYARIEREWRDGEAIHLNLPMPVERIYAHPSVRMANGKVALQRGPVIYCIEEVDNRVVPLNKISLPRSSQFAATYHPDLLGGIVVVTGAAEVMEDSGWEGMLYRDRPGTTKPCTVSAVPYCVWGNRDPGQMLVWLRENACP
ncbi:MAG: glycoside hydrolase family 127 protein [Firmicutes bacterium]|nr:glycoside hydrolase family 127 protein [Bacillota bacterium]